ncbi:MAG TPA: fatty acid desaturase [Vicinamibacterales bacterium]|nr:fatty acid desaturase [Vicinamibacterales bacterium]
MSASLSVKIDRFDALFVGLALIQGGVLVLAPNAVLVGIGMWWNANTVSHNFIHRPFFRRRSANALFSAYLTLLIGVPQRLWRDRHLAHHAGRRYRPRLNRQITIEFIIQIAIATAMLNVAPRFLLTVYLPGIAMGLILCAIHGHYEHADGPISHYGRAYNLLFFNDGYHSAHHARPGVHWSRLPEVANESPTFRSSRWPPILRWIDAALEWMERMVLKSKALERVVLADHRRAIVSLMAGEALPKRVAIVGGGLFPRTALIFRELAPAAALVIIDASAPNLEVARSRLDGEYEWLHSYYEPGRSLDGVDLLVIPLSFRGDRDTLYQHPPAPRVLIHDWIWHRCGRSAVVSPLLLKRINLVTA